MSKLAPRSWAGRPAHNLIYEVDKGNYFAAWQEPDFFTTGAGCTQVPAFVGPPATEVAMAEIRPFHVDVTDEMLDDLRRRIGETRWPNKELVADRSQGVQLATLQELARYWANDYDWRRCEARLNGFRSSRPRSTGWTSTSST